MKPSNFCIEPWSCVFATKEHEIIALNIMRILKRTGDEWRVLTWDEYTAERAKDGATDRDFQREKSRFDDVVEYTISADAARKFSLTWRK